MSDDLRDSLEAQRKERIARASRRLLDGESAQAIRPDLDEIDAYSKLLAAVEPARQRTWIMPAVVAVVCVAVAGLLWSMKVRRTNIFMTADTESMRFVLARPWRLENAFHSAQIHGERLSTIHAPNLGLNFDESSADAWFELSGGTSELAALEIDGGVSLEADTDRDEIDLYASGGRLRGTLNVSGKVTVTAGPRAGETTVNQSYQLDIPETVELAVSKPQRIASQLSVHGPGAWSLGRPVVNSLDLAREESRGAGKRSLISGVKRGTLRFDDVSWPAMDLREGDMVATRPTESAVLMARSEGEAIHVTLSGAVDEVRAGDATSQRTLAPSYLEYLYSQKSLSFFWGAIVFLWGFIWSVRNTIFRR
jgi:hypothetical protein